MDRPEDSTREMGIGSIVICLTPLIVSGVLLVVSGRWSGMLQAFVQAFS